MFTFSVVVVDLPIDCILSFLFPAETDVLVPVLSQLTDVVVVNFVVVLKFPNKKSCPTRHIARCQQGSNMVYPGPIDPYFLPLMSRHG